MCWGCTHTFATVVVVYSGCRLGASAATEAPAVPPWRYPPDRPASRMLHGRDSNRDDTLHAQLLWARRTLVRVQHNVPARTLAAACSWQRRVRRRRGKGRGQPVRAVGRLLVNAYTMTTNGVGGQSGCTGRQARRTRLSFAPAICDSRRVFSARVWWQPGARGVTRKPCPGS